MSVAFGTLLQVFGSIFIPAIHAAVTVMVDRTIAHIMLIHQVYNVHDGLGIVRSVAVNLYIEYVATTCQLVIWTFDTCLVLGGAMVIDRDMIGVGIILAVGDTRQDAEALAVLSGKLTRQPFGGSSQYRVVGWNVSEYSLMRLRIWRTMRRPSA